MPQGAGIGGMEGERLQFVLPSFPVSFNRLYDINHRQRRVYLSDDAALWKTRTIPFVKPCRWPLEWLLSLTLVYESPNWLTKQGKLRRVDVQNLEKLVIDTMFAKWGWDDSRLVDVVRLKRYGPREQILVKLERMVVELGGSNGNHQ
jgi:Holliday junction resolvase RusA-like endonuclease